MREIKFRGKSLETGEWIFGDLIENQGRFFIYKASSETTFKDDDDGQIVLVAKEVDQKTVGQYVGIRDATGQKIYDGDIIRDWRGVREVKFEIFDNRQGYEIELDDSDLEVIGNIHDNPELLKGGEE